MRFCELFMLENFNKALEASLAVHIESKLSYALFCRIRTSIVSSEGRMTCTGAASEVAEDPFELDLLIKRSSNFLAWSSGLTCTGAVLELVEDAVEGDLPLKRSNIFVIVRLWAEEKDSFGVPAP